MASTLLTVTVGGRTWVWHHHAPAVTAADSDRSYQVQQVCGGTGGAGGLWSPSLQKACIQGLQSHLEPIKFSLVPHKTTCICSKIFKYD